MPAIPDLFFFGKILTSSLKSTSVQPEVGGLSVGTPYGVYRPEVDIAGSSHGECDVLAFFVPKAIPAIRRENVSGQLFASSPRWRMQASIQ